MRLNLGAGTKVIPGYINVDRARLDTTDQVWDLDHDGPWPWDTSTIDRIEAAHIFEHVWFPIHFMTEAHRVLVPGGRLHLLTPDVSSMDSFTDPTHVRHCTIDSFAFWVPGNPHYDANNAAYGGVAFDAIEVAVRDRVIDITLAKIPDRDPVPADD